MTLYRCPQCSATRDELYPAAKGDIVHCPVHSCRGECERVLECEAIGCHDERVDECCDYCVSHAIEAIADDRSFFDTLTTSAKAEVVSVMARRLRGVSLTRRQAA
jgi:hypothetical protein